MSKIGIISDTHGLLRTGVISAFQGCELIIHAGDIGKEEVLLALCKIAPVVAVRGNIDTGGWAERLPLHHTVTIHDEKITVTHILRDEELSFESGIYVSGHSHEPRIIEQGRRLLINPGSAGPRRFRLPVTVALLELGSGRRTSIVSVV